MRRAHGRDDRVFLLNAYREPYRWRVGIVNTAHQKRDEPKKYKCPCCGYYTFDKKDRAYDICPVCFWEDDPEQYANPLMANGANHVSLATARINYKHFAACDPEMKKYVRGAKKDELHGYER